MRASSLAAATRTCGESELEAQKLCARNTRFTADSNSLCAMKTCKNGKSCSWGHKQGHRLWHDAWVPSGAILRASTVGAQVWSVTLKTILDVGTSRQLRSGDEQEEEE